MTRVKVLVLVSLLVVVSGMWGRAKTDAAGRAVSTARQPAATATLTSKPAKVDFNAQIRPILESRCTPCHFAGGKMYERLPFDRPETIKNLGERLFTRIKDEDERRLIREFLSQ